MPLNQIRQKLKNLLNLSKLLPILFSPTSLENNEFVLVTASDSSHYKSLCQFLLSLFKYEPNIRAIVYDLGLTEIERQYIKHDFPSIELRLFDYSKYPNYFNIKVNAGEYAWKPVIVCDILNEFKCCVCWMDAGNIITAPLVWIRKIIYKVGMYSPYSSGRISDWTHPKTLELLNVSKDLLCKPNLNGACVAVFYQNLKVRRLVEQWKKYALLKEYIAPIGSSKTNHRQDQAILSVIAYQSGITNAIPSGFYGFMVHKDID
jgi:Protein of unknown function (DUF1647)